MMEIKAPRAKLKIRGLVRDKHGKPKFDDPAKIKQFAHRLSDEDIAYLEQQFGIKIER